MIAWMFPGQGSQKAGMAADIAACGPLFARARAILGMDLEMLCTGDLDPVWTPEAVQPAIFITCLGMVEKLAGMNQRPGAVVGHSLGELAALTATGAISFDDGLRLVDLRARAMGAAGRANPGGMAAVLGLDPAAVEDICASQAQVWVANYNSPRQTVISGTDDALAATAELCLGSGAAKVVRLQVPMACHCPLMEPARLEFGQALESVTWRSPSCPVYSGADGTAHTDPAEIAVLLAEAITSPVRFVQTVTCMRRAGLQTFVEVGPGKVLRGLVRQIDPGATLAGVSNDLQAGAAFGSEPALEGSA